MGTAVAIPVRLLGGPCDGARIVLPSESDSGPAIGDEVFLLAPRGMGADEPELARRLARYRLAADGRWRFEP